METPPYSDGRLYARLAPPPALPPPEPGVHLLTFPDGRTALLHAPDCTRPAPLLLLLHGAGGQHGGGDRIALEHAARLGALLLVPNALSSSWDVLRGGYGPDLAFLDSLLHWTMRRYAIAPDALAIGGFSDGASYALSVGLMNGDLFRHILAFSPGFARPLRRVGRPRVFIAHGQADAVLPVARGQDIARQLSIEGYEVQYEEFAGDHSVSAALAGPALRRALHTV